MTKSKLVDEFSFNWAEKAFLKTAPRPLKRRYVRSKINAYAEHAKLFASYEAAKQSRTHRAYRASESPNDAVAQSAVSLREQVRWLQHNNDVVNALIGTITTGVVGESGIGVQPAPKRLDGSTHKEVQLELNDQFAEFCQSPEVTGSFSMSQLERMAYESFLRDGELFTELVIGRVRGLKHPNKVLPFSLQVLEADFVPSEVELQGSFSQGVQLNQWNQPVNYSVYLEHPLESLAGGYSKTRTVPASRMLHFANRDSIHAIRGVTPFAPVLKRIDGLDDYESSEIVAARIAAAITLVLEHDIGLVDEDLDFITDDLDVELSPGHRINLKPGQKASLLESNRPSALLCDYREVMVNSICSSLGANASTVKKNYNGSYSSQRQELVESHATYGVMSRDFIDCWVSKVYRAFVRSYDLYVKGSWPSDLDRKTLFNAEYQSPSMKWIDPMKEAQALSLMIEKGLMSESEAIQSRGKNPAEVKRQIESERKNKTDMGLGEKQDAEDE